MQQTKQPELTIDANGVPPSQAEIDAYIASKRCRIEAIRQKEGLSVLVAVVGGSVCFLALVVWLPLGMPSPSDTGRLIAFVALGFVGLLGVCSLVAMFVFDLKQREVQQELGNIEPAKLYELEDLANRITKTGIRPDYLNGVAAQGRNLTVAETTVLRNRISQIEWERKQAATRTAIQTTLGIPAGQSDSPSKTADTTSDDPLTAVNTLTIPRS